MTGKVVLALMLTASFLPAAGCGRGERPESEPPRAGAGPADYPALMSEAKGRASAMEVLLPLRQALEAFAAIEGRYPGALPELVDGGYLPAIPAPPPGMRLRYDPSDGSVTLVPR